MIPKPAVRWTASLRHPDKWMDILKTECFMEAVNRQNDEALTLVKRG